MRNIFHSCHRAAFSRTLPSLPQDGKIGNTDNASKSKFISQKSKQMNLVNCN